ncbi:DUF2793 domain-containing protein, partial [Litorisediminicola beolgyonensis]
MSETSPALALPYLAPAQAQKHVTVNEALRRLDALVQLVFEEVGRAAPPALPEEGRAYVTGPGATDAWAGQAEGVIAAWQDGAWAFIEPRPGWQG